MKSIKKINVLHIFLIFALVVGLLSTSILFVCNIIDKYSRVESAISNPNQDIFDGGGGGGGGGGSSGETIEADLTIYTATTLKEFIADVRGGNNYEGKIVVLGGSFFVGEIEPIGCAYDNKTNGFNGTFDGRGYILSNVVVKGYAYYDHQIIGGGSHYVRDYTYKYVTRSALFGGLGDKAIIRNLAINGISYSLKGIDKPNVSGITVTWDITQTAPAAIYTDSSTSARFECIRVDGVSGFSSAFGNGAANVKDCDLRNTKGLGYGVKCISSIFRPQSGYTCSKPFGDGSTYCYSSSSNVIGLSYSAVGGEEGSTWYYAPEYSVWPLIRVFMKSWNTVSFTSGGSVKAFSPASIKIPSDATKTFSSDSNKITIYGQTVEATSSICHVEFSWSCSSATSYTCAATAVQRTVTIKTKIGSGTANLWKTVTVNCGSAISVATEQWLTSGKYKSCTINGNKYESTNLYYLTVDCSNGTIIHEDTEITITLHLKSYNVQVE